MDEKQSIKHILVKAIYVDFYTAMINDNYKLSNLTVEEYAEALVAFNESMKIKNSGVEKQLQSIHKDIILLSNCLIIFPTIGVDKDNLKIVEDRGVELNDDLQILLDNIQEKLNKLVTKYSFISGVLPDMSKIIKPTGEDMIAELSLAIEMMLPMNINLLEYMSYHKAARKKGESIKKAQGNVNRR